MGITPPRPLFFLFAFINRTTLLKLPPSLAGVNFFLPSSLSLSLPFLRPRANFRPRKLRRPPPSVLGRGGKSVLTSWRLFTQRCRPTWASTGTGFGRSSPQWAQPEMKTRTSHGFAYLVYERRGQRIRLKLALFILSKLNASDVKKRKSFLFFWGGGVVELCSPLRETISRPAALVCVAFDSGQSSSLASTWNPILSHLHP